MEFVTLNEYPNYEIHSSGKVYRIKKEANNGKVLKRRELYPTKAKNGYRTVKLKNKYGNVKQLYLHRLIWEAFNGKIPPGLEVCHDDCNRSNNCLDNLELLTHTQNCRNPESIRHYIFSNRISAGKFDRDKMIAAQGKENHDRLVNTYHELKKVHNNVGIWLLMKEGHCGYPRAKKIIAEMESKNDVNL